MRRTVVSSTSSTSAADAVVPERPGEAADRHRFSEPFDAAPFLVAISCGEVVGEVGEGVDELRAHGREVPVVTGLAPFDDTARRTSYWIIAIQ